MSSEALERAKERLKSFAEGCSTPWFWLQPEDGAALLAEVARLEQALANAEGDHEHTAMRRKMWRERAESAEADLAAARAREQRLREALAGIMEYVPESGATIGAGYGKAADVARAALAAEPAADEEVWNEDGCENPGAAVCTYPDCECTAGTPSAAADEPGERP